MTTADAPRPSVTANWKVVSSLNPHIKYHSARRGYVACTVTSANFRAEFKVIDRVTVPDEPVRTDKAFVVEAGSAGIKTA